MNMRSAFSRAFATLAVAILMTSCTSSGDISLHSLSDAEWDSVGKLRNGKYGLISDQDLATLKQQADVGKRVGRYQIDKEGTRTWRLDSATGKLCLLLAPEEDWKKPNIQAQVCDAE